MRDESKNSAQRRIEFEDPAAAFQLFGTNESIIKIIEKRTGISISTRGTQVVLWGENDDIQFVESLLRQLYRMAKKGLPLYPADVERALDVISRDANVSIQEIFEKTVYVSIRNKVITSRSPAQRRYIELIRKEDMVFGIGPAGTGKTYLAMAMAVSALLRKEVKRIILTRPAVEAGEKLGFLPGDLAEKVNPYLRPLYDALNEMLDYEKANLLIEQGVIEVAPLAFMRGRTLNGAFIILDEAQNTTCEQMKMFLTRMGYDSKAVITGDITQIDLPAERPSGLIQARDILESIEGIGFAYFTEADVVRHPLVQKVVRAFEKHENEKLTGGSRNGHNVRNDDHHPAAKPADEGGGCGAEKA